MDLQKNLADAQILRVAIVDDDLSELISVENLRQVDGDLEALLRDTNDPDRELYLKVLGEFQHGVGASDDLAAPLSDPLVRARAPARLREAAELILEARRASAEPVFRVKKLLEDSGISSANIDTYSSPSLPHDKHYDLVIVDYFLVDNSTKETAPFIQRVVGLHDKQERPLQIILMSSHEAGLRDDFRELRPQVGVSSSRMRILAKPQDDAQLSSWKLTLDQLATDRDFVKPIEAFVGRAIDTINDMAAQQSRKLWELDLHAMTVLYQTATSDKDDYCRYVEECLSRYLLTHLESARDIRGALEQLRGRLDQSDKVAASSPGVEIGDSRAAVRGLMTSMVWRGGGAPQLPPFPVDLSQGPKWVQAALRFGMVLKDPRGSLWLNLTQSCDLAQAKDDLPEVSLLLVNGAMSHPTRKEDANALVHMSAAMTEEESETITWHLKRIYTPSVKAFATCFTAGWTVVGELRLDQVQHVVASYGAQATRVALQRSVKSWRLQGFAMRAASLRDAQDEDPLAGTPVEGQALEAKSGQVLHFELATYNALQAAFPGAVDDAALRLCTGVALKRGKKIMGSPYLLYCADAPATMKELRDELNDSTWLQRPDNAEKLLVAVWAS